jgi:hypothetical protein
MVDTADVGQSEEDHEDLVLAEEPVAAGLALDFAALVEDVEEPEFGL